MQDSVTSEEDLEALMEGMAYIPGHFHLDLHLNGEARGSHPGRADLRRRDTLLRLESLRAQQLEAECGPLQYAARNLLGLLDFHLERLDEAEEAFRAVCRDDPGNLNAWANLGYVYDRLGREAEAGECVERVSALMGLRDRDRDEEQDRCRLRAARCLAEHAYTQPWDVELEGDTELRERLTAALTLYNRALDYGAQLIPIEEKRSWYFKMATIYIRLDGLIRDQEDAEYSRLPLYNKAMRLLTDVLESDRVQLKALAWCNVGVLLERKDEFSTVPMAVHDCGYTDSEPLSCYGLAIKFATDDALILNQLANIFLQLGKHDMATGISNMALNVLPDPELNWQAYCNRAKINVMTYVRDLDRAKQGHGGIPDRQSLREAKADLERVQSVRPCLRTHLEMAQVHYYMGVDAVQESLLVDEAAVNSALVCLARALQCPPGESLAELQLLRGRCLLLKGEENNAVDCFLRALELQRPGAADSAVLRCLLTALLACCCQGPDPDSAICRLEESVRRAEKSYSVAVVRAELRTLCRAHTADVTELSKTLVKRGRTKLVRHLLESLQPRVKPPLTRSFTV
ncbi:tetratricopeptide repeat protein 22 [Engraulis encrasicolus]|uniref:tetratricopeptide repeat protein 22 n=1 Tax=Engraulis encrasicolus TaxID=184585 RepID=UPI002FD70AD6